MSEQAMIQRNDAQLTVSYTKEAIALRDAALELSGIVARVSNPEENNEAVAAQTELQRIKQLAEKARKQAKEPVLDYGRKIDAAAKDFIAEVDDEQMRLAKLVGDYQALEQAKARAAEQARLAELSRIEKEKAEALAKVTSHEQADAIQAHFNEVAKVTAPPPVEPVRAAGQVVKVDWEITVTNPYELAKYHPACVKIEPRLAEIKQLLAEGITVKGIKAEKVTKASVRVNSGRAMVEV